MVQPVSKSNIYQKTLKPMSSHFLPCKLSCIYHSVKKRKSQEFDSKLNIKDKDKQSKLLRGKYEMLEIIGKGNFGETRKVFCKDSRRFKSMKNVNMSKLTVE